MATTTLPPSFDDVYDAWNQSHINQFGQSFNRSFNSDPEARSVLTGLQNEYDQKLAAYNAENGTNFREIPSWTKAWQSWQDWHRGQYGIPMDRAWNADPDAAGAKAVIDTNYQNQLAAYNQEYGTQLQANPDLLGPNNQAGAGFLPKPEKKGFAGGSALGTLAGIALAPFTGGSSLLYGTLGGAIGGGLQSGSLSGALKGASIGALGGWGAGTFGAGAAAELGAWGAASSGEMAAALAADATAYGTGAGAFGFDAAAYAANAGAGLGAIEGAGGAFDAAGLEIGGDSIGNAARYGASYQPTWMDQLRQFWNGTPPTGTPGGNSQDRGWGPLIQGGMSVANGIYGLTQAEQQRKRALEMAAGADPWGTSGGRSDAARRLMELNRDPTGAMASDPRYAAMVQAAQRTMGRKGQDSGAMAVAGAEAGGNWLTQRMNELGMQAGIGFSPTNAASIGLQGIQGANDFAGQSLASIGYGVNTAMGGTNSSQQMLAQLAALIKQNRVS